jgi:hypothetical protein
MNEGDMQRMFGKYLEENLPDGNEVYELKFTSGKSIPFNKVKKHQIENLEEAETGGFYHRIKDEPWGYTRKHRFTLKKPFDCLAMPKARGYIVVWFYHPRAPKKFIKIRLKDYLIMKENAGRKSFTEEMAMEHASRIIKIK